MDAYISHNLKKITTGETAYYPYSIFSSKGYIINPKIESRLKYRFRGIYITYSSIVFLALIISIFLADYLYINRIFPYLMMIMIVLIPLIASYHIRKSICKNLVITNERFAVRERFKSAFYPNRKTLARSIIWSSIIIIMIGAILIFSNNPIDHIWRVAVFLVFIIFFLLLF